MSVKNKQIKKLSFFASLKVPKEEEKFAPGLLKSIIKKYKSAAIKSEYEALDRFEQNNNQIRISIIGGRNVGKSSIAKRYTEDEFDTSGVKYEKNDSRLKKYVNINGPKLLNLRVHHIEERLHQINARGDEYFSDCIVIVFDITNKHNLKQLKDWLYEYEVMASEKKCFIAFNKYDEKNSLTTSKEALIDTLCVLGIEREDVFFISAKKGSQIESMFSHIVNSISLLRNQDISEDEEDYEVASDVYNESNNKSKSPIKKGAVNRCIIM